MRDMATGRARGFAFVEMSTDEEAQKAIQDFHEYSLAAGADRQRGSPKPESSGSFRGGDASRRGSEPRW